MPKKSEKSTPIERPVPARTLEGRENQMIALAERVAENQMLEGTASSQVIVHYLRLGSTKHRLEMEKLRHETALLEARKVAIDSAQHYEEVAKAAMEAMRSYKGEDYDDEEELP